ncbi:hypothetical protein BHE74_00034475 [Ensete ventricosum]|uniref:Uncharacterized protein n=1 Tax=Ensete ventricosum TaxID=4639 RepID=A0A426ZUN8_ENSVE|nr:hypothetical protein B296_00028993 [Ensete ventricosum]RWW58680.1 hypothetical protein BHE74_00034475 [Ensete ventricosum]RZS21738.1 hypothetical protein BHM03_00054411 [Ensete ventricosum]
MRVIFVPRTEDESKADHSNGRNKRNDNRNGTDTLLPPDAPPGDAEGRPRTGEYDNQSNGARGDVRSQETFLSRDLGRAGKRQNTAMAEIKEKNNKNSTDTLLLPDAPAGVADGGGQGRENTTTD